MATLHSDGVLIKHDSSQTVSISKLNCEITYHGFCFDVYRTHSNISRSSSGESEAIEEDFTDLADDSHSRTDDIENEEAEDDMDSQTWHITLI